MSMPIDSIRVRQGRLGKQVLAILVVSLALAFMSAWVLWGAVATDAGTEGSQARSVPSAEPVLAVPAADPATD